MVLSGGNHTYNLKSCENIWGSKIKNGKLVRKKKKKTCKIHEEKLV